MNSRLSNTFCIPSLSGTFGIPAKLALNPKMPKEPSSPSRSNARIERRIHIEKNQGQRTTRNIRKPGDLGNLNFCTFTQIRNSLIGWSFEIPASAYSVANHTKKLLA